MIDMMQVTQAKSDQHTAEDFLSGPRTFTIEDIKINPGTEQPVQIKLVGSDKVFRPCKTVSRILVAAWGADANVYRGRSLTLYMDPTVTWGGMKVGGIRVSHMTDLTAPLVIALQEKKGSRKMTTVQPLKVAPAVDEAAKWTDEQTTAIKAAPDIEALDRVMTLAAKGLGRLRANRPELLTLVTDAEATRRDELANPTADEGKPDDEHGEGFVA